MNLCRVVSFHSLTWKLYASEGWLTIENEQEKEAHRAAYKRQDG